MLALFLAPQNAFTEAAIPDILKFPQDLNFYIAKTTAAKGTISSTDQGGLNRKFDEFFFLPWSSGYSPRDKRSVENRIEKCRKKMGYNKKEEKCGPDWANPLVAKADLNTYPNAGVKAITISDADIRELPTREPQFKTLGACKIKNFDNLQYSSIAVNTPVFLSHYSKDKLWALIESHTGHGWVPTTQIAVVNESFIAAWQTGRYVAITEDDAPVTGEKETIHFKSSIGWLFPKSGEDQRHFAVFTASADENGNAIIKKARISKNYAVEKPLRITSTSVARIGNQMMGKPYGWGGMDGRRDCSSMLKDLFTPFGIWLPRDSVEQVRNGFFVSLKNLAAAEKEKKILSEGIPFLTLIWRKGHILFYIGEYKGTPALFHEAWGATTMDENGKILRRIVGKTIVSSIYHGSGSREKANFEQSLISQVEGMILLVDRKSH